MRGKNSEKSARLMALAHAIQEGCFNPETVNMAEIGEMLGVSRGTIMRDLNEIQSMLDESKKIQAKLRNSPITNSHRNE